MTTSEITTNSKRPSSINELTALRGIFMLTIFLHHFYLYDGAGYMAVTFFFVLSGFSLTIGYYHKIIEDSFSVSSFYKRRFSRLYPIHWLCFVFVLPLVESIYNIRTLPILILNFSLLHSIIPIKAIYFSCNFVSWYLSDIVLMAALFPFIFRWIRKSLVYVNIAMLGILVVAYLIIVRSLPTEWHHALLYINPITRLIDFVIGICVGLLFLHWEDKKIVENNNGKRKIYITFVAFVSFLIIFVISLTVSIDNPYSIALFYWLPVAILIFSVSVVSKLGGAFLLKNGYMIYLGNISLSFFMIHQIIIRYARLIHKMLYQTDDISNPLWIVSIFIIVLLLSHCSNRYFEKPVAKWLIKK